ncbi:uncharacterized protein ColSpa_05790 [Colletotrichum spaethianum]|uniref:Uncharacterized protein n=1 Tax=Colletotrichum spaethianum TaxID=700344 RepID=A0AA37LDX4_9PEZI|nr:uncharacterized protein ColSpa_05790 [Colletotrichum spaethianum]GKT45609.1 hypothetical protein ColSpa_05790 [Colletotrichum spaethianum]
MLELAVDQTLLGFQHALHRIERLGSVLSIWLQAQQYAAGLVELLQQTLKAFSRLDIQALSYLVSRVGSFVLDSTGCRKDGQQAQLCLGIFL